MEKGGVIETVVAIHSEKCKDSYNKAFTHRYLSWLNVLSIENFKRITRKIQNVLITFSSKEIFSFIYFFFNCYLSFYLFIFSTEQHGDQVIHTCITAFSYLVWVSQIVFVVICMLLSFHQNINSGHLLWHLHFFQKFTMNWKCRETLLLK